MNRKTGPIAMWILSIAYTCAMSFCLLLMIGSFVAISFASLSRVVGFVIAGLGLAGCLLLILVGGIAVVSAVTVFCMKKFGRGEADRPVQGKPEKEAGEPAETGK